MRLLRERPLRILITNMWLLGRSGSETIVRDVALGLRRRGHSPIIYAPSAGAPADELKARGISVIDSLDQMDEAPDIVHGHHNIPTVEALVRFPTCPAIWFCHDAIAWHDKAPLFERIHRYVAVDDRCRDRLLEDGVAVERITVLHNAVDLERIPPRPEALPLRPQRAVAFTKTVSQIPVLEQACSRAGLSFRAFGRGPGIETAEPERELVKHDIVFATARSAIEALCAGAAVIVCDGRGLGGLVSTDNYERLRALNFGARSLTEDVTVDAVISAIEQYDRDDAVSVVHRLRADADLVTFLDQVEILYCEAIAARASYLESTETHQRTLLQFLHEWLPQAPDNRWPWQKERQALVELCENLDRACADLRRQCAASQSESEALRAKTAEFQNMAVQLQGQLESVRSSRFYRLAAAVHKLLGPSSARESSHKNLAQDLRKRLP